MTKIIERWRLLLLVQAFSAAAPLSEGYENLGTSSGSSFSNSVVARATVEESSISNRTKIVGTATSLPRRRKSSEINPLVDAAKVKTNQLKSASVSNSEGLRRIRSEWKSVVDAGIGYHWRRGRPIIKRGQPSATPSPSHLWLGPLDESNLFIWHFTLVGLPGSPYGSGLYHGRIVLPRTYPLQPPRVSMWTESGRFLPRVDICLSASHYHPETWSPTHWTIRTLVEALRLHMVTPPFEIGGMPNVSYERRLAYAQKSVLWKVHIPLPNGSVITIDHRSMAQQGLFSDLLETDSVPSAPQVSLDVDEQIEPNSSQSDQQAEDQSVHIIAPKRRKKKSSSDRSRCPITVTGTSGAHRFTPNTATAYTRSLEPLVLKVVATALRLAPILVCLILWRQFISWLLP